MHRALQWRCVAVRVGSRGFGERTGGAPDGPRFCVASAFGTTADIRGSSVLPFTWTTTGLWTCRGGGGRWFWVLAGPRRVAPPSQRRARPKALGAIRKPRGLPHTRGHCTWGGLPVWGCAPGFGTPPGNRSGDLSSAVGLSYRWTNRNRRGGGGGGGGGRLRAAHLSCVPVDATRIL